MIKQNYKFQFFLNTEDAEEIFVASIIIPFFRLYCILMHHTMLYKNRISYMVIRLNNTATATFDMFYQILVNKVRERTLYIANLI